MAKKGIEIGVGMNAREVQKGAKDVESALEEVADSLDDVAKDADRAGRKMGDEISDGAKDAERSVDRLERSFKEMTDEARKAARSGDELGGGMKRGTREASEAVETFGDEARQNLSETVSSFRGELEDIPQLAQDILGGAVGDLGPLGMAAGAAGAAGIGLIVAAWQKAKEAEQEYRERVAELTDILIETGGEGAEAIEAVADRMKVFATETDESAMSFAKMREQSEKTGISFKELARAYSGAGGDLNAYIAEVDALAESTANAQERTEDYGRYAGLVRDKEAEQISGVSDELRKLAKETEDAKQDYEDWLAAGGEAELAKAERLSTLQGEIDEVIGSWKDYYNAETGATDPAKYIAAMQARLEATDAFDSNVQTLAKNFGLSFEETQAILNQGVDFAPMLAAIMAGGPEMQEQYAAQIRAMLDGGQAIVDDTELGATVTAQTDTGDAEQQLDQLATNRDAPVTAEPDTKKAEQQLDQLAKKKRTATVTARVDTSAAELALAAWLRRKRTMTVEVEARTREGVLVP